MINFEYAKLDALCVFNKTDKFASIIYCVTDIFGAGGC